MKIVLATIVVFAILVAVGMMYFDGTSSVSERFGRVVSDERVDTGVEAPDLVETEKGEYGRVEREVDSDFLPTRRVSLLGVSLVYPPVLSLEKPDDTTLRLYHTVPSPQHEDFCDLRGPSQKSSSLTDFELTVTAHPLSIAETIRTEYDFLDEYVDEKDKVSLELFANGSDHKVYYYTHGAEGCGMHYYFIQARREVTLVLERPYVPYLDTGIFPDAGEYRKLPDVILPIQADTLVSLIIDGIL